MPNLDFIEDIARRRLEYEIKFEEQAKVLREELHFFQADITKIQLAPLINLSGERWAAGEPTPDKVDEYLAQCDELCNLVPNDLDELSLLILARWYPEFIPNINLMCTHSRVKITQGAHAGLQCLVNCKVSLQSEHIQLAIMKRHHEL
jgi:hypothetical protein